MQWAVAVVVAGQQEVLVQEVLVVHLFHVHEILTLVTVAVVAAVELALLVEKAVVLSSYVLTKVLRLMDLF
jgi:hypothetical protein